MRRASSILLALAAAFVPATAAAAPSSEARSSHATVQFKLTSTNGFRASVETFGREVVLTLSRGAQFAIYRVHGTVSADGDVDARFGSLGRISLSFEPDAVAHDPCREEIEGRAGDFAGTIAFAGERHYVRLRANRVRGHAYFRGEAGGCGRRPSSPGRRGPVRIEEEEAEEGDTAALTLYGPGKRRAFRAIGSRPPAGQGYALFFAVADERRGRMRVSRGLGKVARARTFLFDSSLSTATVRPPKPFQGEGSFQRSPDGSTAWTGSVTAPILGAGRVTVARPGFAATMVREVPGD
jgi:hypothetical protein